MTPQAVPRDRLYFLDWLRILAFGSLVIYHVGMYYVSWDFHVKSPFAGPGLEPWMKLTEPWRMSLIFIISGAATACMLRGGPDLAFVRRRSARLLLPLLLGVVLIVPPQSYLEVVQKFSYAGDYLDFLRLYFTNDRGFCSNGQCLVFPTWNHLWFLPYLWVYTCLACALLSIHPAASGQIARLLTACLGGPGILLAPVACIFLARLTLFERYPSTHALLDDAFNHVVYLGMFACGWGLAASRILWERLACARWPALALACVFWAVLVFARPGAALEHLVVATYQWSALVAAIGFAKTHLDRDSPLRRRLTHAVFPVYILHQTVIIVASQLLLPLRMPPALEAPVLILVAFSLSVAGYVLARPFGWLRPWMGMGPVKAGPGAMRPADA